MTQFVAMRRLVPPVDQVCPPAATEAAFAHGSRGAVRRNRPVGVTPDAEAEAGHPPLPME